VVDEYANKLLLFITVFDKCLFLGGNKFPKNGYTDCKGGMIGNKPLIQMDRMGVRFIRLISKRHEIDD